MVEVVEGLCGNIVWMAVGVIRFLSRPRSQIGNEVQAEIEMATK